MPPTTTWSSRDLANVSDPLTRNKLEILSKLGDAARRQRVHASGWPTS